MMITITSDLTGQSYRGKSLKELVLQCKKDDEALKKTDRHYLDKLIEAENAVIKTYAEFKEACDAAGDIVDSADKKVREEIENASNKLKKAQEEAARILVEAQEEYDSLSDTLDEIWEKSDKEVEEVIGEAGKAWENAKDDYHKIVSSLQPTSIKDLPTLRQLNTAHYKALREALSGEI